MKSSITSLLFLLLFSFASKAQTTPSSEEILKPVYAAATKENKKVLLIFHASWCGWCKKMDASLADSTIKSFIDKNFVITHLSVYESPDKKGLENPGALAMLTKLGGADKGLPYWFMMDAKSNVLADSQIKPGENTGCPASEEEVNYFAGLLQKNTKLNQPALEKIKARFRQNKQPASH